MSAVVFFGMCRVPMSGRRPNVLDRSECSESTVIDYVQWLRVVEKRAVPRSATARRRRCLAPVHVTCVADRYSRRLYILCWREHSRRKLSPTLATPTTVVLTTLVAQCELSRRKIGLLLEVVGRKFSHRPGNPATVGVVRWPAAGDSAGSSLRRLSFLQRRIYNLLVDTAGHRPSFAAAHTTYRIDFLVL